MIRTVRTVCVVFIVHTAEEVRSFCKVLDVCLTHIVNIVFAIIDDLIVLFMREAYAIRAIHAVRVFRTVCATRLTLSPRG